MLYSQDPARTLFRWYRDPTFTTYSSTPDETTPYAEPRGGSDPNALPPTPFTPFTAPRLGIYTDLQYKSLSMATAEARPPSPTGGVYRGCAPWATCRTAALVDQNPNAINNVRKRGVCKTPTGSFPLPSSQSASRFYGNGTTVKYPGEIPALGVAAEITSTRAIEGVEAFSFTGLFRGRSSAVPNTSDGNQWFAVESVYLTDEQCTAGGREIGLDYRLDLPHASPTGMLRFYYSWFTNCATDGYYGPACFRSSNNSPVYDSQTRYVSLANLDLTVSHVYQVTHSKDTAGIHWLTVAVDPANLASCTPSRVNPYDLTGATAPTDPSIADGITVVEISPNSGKCHFKIKLDSDFSPDTLFPDSNGGGRPVSWIQTVTQLPKFPTGVSILDNPEARLISTGLSVTAYQPKYDVSSFGAGTSPSARNFTGQQIPLNFVAESTGGFASIGIVNVLINTYLDGNGACWLVYIQESNELGLVLDDGGLVLRNLSSSSYAPMENSQCKISGGTVTRSGNTITFSGINIEAKQAWGVYTTAATLPQKQIYVAIRTPGDVSFPAAATGWTVQAVWQVPSSISPPPPIARVISTSVSGSLSSLTLAMTVTQNSAAPLQSAWLIVNFALDPLGSCYVPINSIDLSVPIPYLRSAFGEDTFTYFPPTVGGFASNPYCRISGLTVTAVSSSVKNITATIESYLPFSGPKTVFFGAVPSGGGTNSVAWTPVATLKY